MHATTLSIRCALALALASSAPGQQSLFFDDMEAGLSRWTVIGEWFSASSEAACASKAAPFPSGSRAAHVNQPFGSCSFSQVDSFLTLTDPLSLPAGASSCWLSFSSWEEGEGPPYDRPFVNLSIDGGPFVQVWEGFDQTSWYRPCIDLTPYLGSEVVVQFHFRPMDPFANDFVGWLVDDVSVTIDDVRSYCTAGVSASGCQAVLSAAGIPDVSEASGFVVSAAAVEGGKSGFFYYGFNGAQAQQWGNGTSFQCVVPPVKRTPLMTGVGTPGACDGLHSLDLTSYWSAAPPSKQPLPGQEVHVQLWYRDPQSTSNRTRSLSDGLVFTACP